MLEDGNEDKDAGVIPEPPFNINKKRMQQICIFFHDMYMVSSINITSTFSFIRLLNLFKKEYVYR